MQKYVALFFLTSLVFQNGCGGKNNNVATVEFNSKDIKDGVLPIIKDKSVLLGIVAKDGNGKAIENIDTEGYEWEISNPDIFTFRGLGDVAIITGLQDWFDVTSPSVASSTIAATSTITEPLTTLSVKYGDAKTTIQIFGIINVEGAWHLTVGDFTQDLMLTQNGRRVDLDGAIGTINGIVEKNSYIIPEPFMGITLKGTFISREEIRGTYINTTANTTGTWTAIKQP